MASLLSIIVVVVVIIIVECFPSHPIPSRQGTVSRVVWAPLYQDPAMKPAEACFRSGTVGTAGEKGVVAIVIAILYIIRSHCGTATVDASSRMYGVRRDILLLP